MMWTEIAVKTQADALARVDSAALRGLEFKPEEEEELLAWFEEEFAR